MYYKYRDWNDYSKAIFRTHSFYYSDANIFNDLHECVISPEQNSTIHGHSNLIFDARKNYRILCLSRTKNSSLMWAHYANSYKGICLEFDFVSGDNHFNKPNQIIYQDTPPIITDSQLRSKTDISREMFLYKHSLWAYEQEWRVFKPNTDPHIVPFHPNSLKAVYIGPPSTSRPIFNEVFNEIKNYNTNNRTNVHLIRLRRKDFSYDIEEEVIF